MPDFKAHKGGRPYKRLRPEGAEMLRCYICSQELGVVVRAEALRIETLARDDDNRLHVMSSVPVCARCYLRGRWTPL